MPVRGHFHPGNRCATLHLRSTIPPAEQALSLIYTPQPRQFGEESRLVVRLGDEVDCSARQNSSFTAAAASSMIARMAFSAATSSCSRIARATSSCNAIASVFGRSGIMP